MKQPIRYLLNLLMYYLVVFAVCKMGFMAYNHAAADFTLLDAGSVWWHGLTLDLAMAAYLLIVPAVGCLIGIWWPRFALRRILMPYFLLTGVAMAAFTLADMVLYGYWKFKLDSSIYNYINLDNGAAESVSVLFLLAAVVGLVAISLLLSVPAIRMTPRSFRHKKGMGTASPLARRSYGTVGMLLVSVLIGALTMGGRENGQLSVGSAYYSPSLFLNHAAVNPLYSLLASTTKMVPFERQFRYMPEEEADRLLADAYPCTSATPADSTAAPTEQLLNTQRPNIIFVQWESLGGQFVEELGGLPDVCPNLSRYISEGILFEQCYANSFRTDRGTVSTLSGQLSYPTVSLMKHLDIINQLPGIAHSLTAAGYTTDYTYGGRASVMGKGPYLLAAGYQRIISEPDFHLKEGERTSWGVRDERMLTERGKQLSQLPLTPDQKPWMSVLQTIDSHEPFEVPYKRLEDKVQNAFAYTDHYLGIMLDSLRHSPQWDNLLVVIYADHGIMYRQSYEDPEFFRIPMVWTGGAVKEPRRIATLMNQSDLAATLLAQMGISHADYPWSRNVLSADYRQPFVYCSYPSGIMYKDAGGVVVHDTNADRTVVAQPALNQFGTADRVARAKAILQKSYDQLAHLQHK